MADGQVIDSAIPAEREEPAKEPSIRDELLSAFEGATTETTEPPKKEEAQSAEAKTAEQRARDDAGRFAKKTEAQTAQSPQKATGLTGEAETAVVTPAVAPVEPPAHWSEADKTRFRNVPEESRAWIMDRHRAMEGDYTRKMQGLADFSKTYAPIEELFKPYAQEMSQRGTTKTGLIQAWAAAELRLNKDPLDGIAHIMRAYGVTPEALAQTFQQNPNAGAQQQIIDPRITQLQQRVEAWEQGQQQERLTQTRSTIDQFAQAKAADGSLLRPHFDEVVEDMSRLAQVERAAGRVPDMQKLYETAVWANDGTRQKLLSAREQAAQKQATDAARTKSASARRAGSSVSGAPTGPAQTVKPSGSSVRDAILAAHDEVVGAG